MTRTLALALLFLPAACSASMRPIPNDVEPVPRFAQRDVTLADGGAVAMADAAVHTAELPHGEHTPACADRNHHPLHVQQVAGDRWIIARSVVDYVRSERKAQLSPQIDAATGRTVGLSIEDIGDNSCLGALGFRNGDLLRSVNGHDLVDWSTNAMIYQSIVKDGNAVVRLDRAGRPMTVLYEVRNE